jgi:tetratricopeptide (TPR) repeat protein
VPPRALVLLVGLSACHLQPASPRQFLESAASDAEGGAADARTLALAGFEAYLLRGDVEKAQSRFDASLQHDPAEPYALYGQLLLARRRGHLGAALSAALSLCERAPRHPLAASAARFVLDVAGAATPLDDLILQRAEPALSAGLGGDAAHLMRSAVATIQGQRAQGAAQSATLAAMGIADAYTTLGPFSPFRVLSFDEVLAPEKDGSLAGPFPSAWGPLEPRTLLFPDGRISLAGSGARGDEYLLATDLDVAEAGDFAVRSVCAASLKVYLDGQLLVQRRAFERAQPTVNAAGVWLGTGRHRLLVKVAKGDGAGNLTVAVLRLDGKPAGLTFHPATGAEPAFGEWKPAPLQLLYPDAAQLAAALRGEAGELLATFLASRDGVGRDRDGVKALVDGLPSDVDSPAVQELKADLSMADHSVPAKVAHGRATRDYEAAVEKDPGDVNALLSLATLALDDGRSLEASDFARQARAAHGALGYPVPLMQARIALAMGSEAQAEQLAQEALAVQPGLCDANVLRYDLARRRDAAALADQLVSVLASCPGGESRAAEHAKTRGDNGKAIALYQQLLARDPTHVPTAAALANLYVAQQRFEEAARLYADLTALWPRSTQLLKHEADVYEFWGKPQDALKLRQQALRDDGGDLSLRRAVDRTVTGAEPLQEYAISGKAAITAYEAQRGDEDATSALVLDFAAIRAYPDGSMLDRIHIIQKALDQNGVQEIAEVNIPAGSQVLALRTLKPDGTSLEPESFEDKETVSMPGVQVGDYVEQEFLEAHPARGPVEPGFTASNFYFQVQRSPNNWSTYTVIAPKGSGMSVDAHHMASNPPEVRGDLEVYKHEERHVPPYIPEPNSPPSQNEYLPFVAVGAGARGNDGVVAAYADSSLDHGQLTYEVESFARKATEGKKGVEQIRALYAAVMEKLQGRDLGLGISAAASVAQDHGSRLWLLKASLEALGYPSRVAAVRTFGVDPGAYVFPDEQLLQYVAVRTELADGSILWLDPLVRFAPFGELPEQALGGRDAYLLPEPGRPLQTVKTPSGPPSLGKQVRLSLKLTADGQLSGTGVETYTGFDAAQLAEALDQLAPEARNQALQRALSRYFGGANLSGVELDMKREVGAPMTVTYHFTAPRYARVEGGKLVMGPLTYPVQLGQRFVQVGSRRTPLYIEGTELVDSQVTLELPPGYQMSSPVPEVKTAGAFGSFIRHEQQEPGKLRVDEKFRLNMGRVPVDTYDDFAQFAGEVDLVQTRELVVEKRG